MLDFLQRHLVLHLLLNTAFVGFGVVVGLLLAWRVGLERRFDVRPRFLRVIVVVAVVLAGLITLLTADSRHLVLCVVGGVVAGFVAAYLSRAQAK
jgi:phage shock protein PspC (stress-responsive transcriptional regulator)